MSRPLRVALIGCGNIAVNSHLPAFLADPARYQVVAVADPTPSRLGIAREAAGLGLNKLSQIRCGPSPRPTWMSSTSAPRSTCAAICWSRRPRPAST